MRRSHATRPVGDGPQRMAVHCGASLNGGPVTRKCRMKLYRQAAALGIGNRLPEHPHLTRIIGKPGPGSNVYRQVAGAGVMNQIRHLIQNRYVLHTREPVAVEKQMANAVSERRLRHAANTCLGRSIVGQTGSRVLVQSRIPI